MELRECVFIDGVRTANVRAHAQKGWFKELKPDQTLAAVYKALFERNPKVKPEDVDTVIVGTANPSGYQNDIGRLAWLAHGYPERVGSQTVSNQCPSGMTATINAARAIMTGEADIMIAAGVEDMEKVPMGANMAFPDQFMQRYFIGDIPMGNTAEKVAEMYDISRADMENMAIYSHKNAHAATISGKFKKEIVPLMGKDEAGNDLLVEKDQWIRETLDPAHMATMRTPFKLDGRVTAATSSPLTAGAAALLMMSRKKADELGLSYTYKYSFGVQEGNDPTIMGMGPAVTIEKIIKKTGIKKEDIGVVEMNEAFAAQALACIRETGIDKPNAPFDKVNLWGGAIALGHPLGESGARIIVTLLNVMKTEKPDAKYGIATLCGGFGNGVAVLIEKV
ncbi:MAG: thiolase family protein [Proteobacteria bacterium]|nr:thiolase family protein [Pseudomonadota bacterium]